MRTIYTKENPFLSHVTDRYSLCQPGSPKNTQHLVLNLERSGIAYHVGDSIGILPVHDTELVERTLLAMRVKCDESVCDKGSDHLVPLLHLLIHKRSITEVSRKLLNALAHKQQNVVKQAQLQALLMPENKLALKEYIGSHEVWDTLHEHHEVCFAAEEWPDLLMPLLPRFYSIASSQKVAAEEVHLTIALLEYQAGGHVRRGVCTHYLCKVVKMHEPVIPLFVQPSHGFTLPENPETSIIMVGPGTGVAPYRAFMQERIATGATGKNWLFFGEWNRSHHFFYQDYWLDLEAKGQLRLDVAFSRDQHHKVYVQDRMLEQQRDIFAWLQNGAHLYVCGDAQRMAKDVEVALHQILKEAGQMSDQAARDYIKQLRIQKRYLRDVY